MKTRFFIGNLLIICMLYSCISKKKYNEAISSADEKQKELAAQLNKTKSEMEDLQKTSEAELKKENDQLKERDARLQELKDAMNAQRDAVLNLKKEVCAALKCFSPDELSVEIREGKLYVSMSEKLLFPSGSDVVNDRGKDAVLMLSNVLGNSGLEIMIEGHTDKIPINNSRNKDNWDLSVHRATSVSRLMIANGIKPERVIPCGRGEFHPIASNETENGRQLNRRTEIVLAPKLDKLWKLTEEPGLKNAEASAE